MPVVTVIIPNWNGMEHLPLCLGSLKRQKFHDFDTIVVDNRSEDGSVTYIKQHFPRVRVIELSSNKGFCAAINAGIQASNSKYIALLNNDVEVDENWLCYLYNTLQQNPQVGFCACKIKNFYDRNVIGDVGDGMYENFFPFSRGAGELDYGQYDRPEYVFGACGAAAFYRRELFDAIGLFDEDFFAYYEDVDLSFRAQLAGFRCLYVPRAVCYHKGGGTISRIKSSFKIQMSLKNQIGYLLKCLPLLLAKKHLPLFFITKIYQTFRLIFIEKQIKAVLTAYWDAVTRAPNMYRKRKHVQKCKVVSNKYIESILTPFTPFKWK